MCFKCREKEHYKSKCPLLMKKKIFMAPKAKEKPKEAKSLVWKNNGHIVYFSCNK